MQKLVESSKTHVIELRGLEDLLRKKLGPKLVLLNSETESLLPLGENYGSTILKVRAVVKRSKEAKDEEEVNLVAKMMPPTDFQRIMFDSPYTFRKEAYLYEELVPAYRQLERELGVPEDELFDILPEFYGARFTRKDEDTTDDDAVLLMQNLKCQGYYTGDRKEGLDFAHAKLAITALARFHALGMAMKRHKPELFATFKERSRCLKGPEDIDFEDSTRFFLGVVHDDSEMSPYFNIFETALRQHQDTAKLWTAVPEEPWSTIVHSDFWVNNVMFRADVADPKRPCDVKFVDFQNYLFLSPLRELTFFVMTNLQADVMEWQFGELIDCYHENFIASLKRLRCDTEPFARDKFDAKMKLDAYEELPHCPFMIKAMTNVANNHEDVGSLILDETANPQMLARLRRCIKKYVELGWLGSK